MIKKLIILAIIIVFFILGIFFGVLGTQIINDKLLMKGYDLYDCIYSNANTNNFNKNPIMIKKIQDECICFREHNYTGMVLGDC